LRAPDSENRFPLFVMMPQAATTIGLASIANGG
jgi:hypothetical protein